MKKTYSYLQPSSKSVVVEYYYQHQQSEPFRFKVINIDANKKMSTAATEETPNYKKISQLIAPEKYLCIKCKQRIARIGIVCDDCLAPMVLEKNT